MATALPIEKTLPEWAGKLETALPEAAKGPLLYAATVARRDMRRMLKASMARARARGRQEAKDSPNQWYGYMERLLKAAGKPADKGGLKRAPKRPLRKRPIIRGRSAPGEPGAAESTNSPFINDWRGPAFADDKGGRLPGMVVGFKKYTPKGHDGLDGLDELEKGATVTRKSRTGWNAVGLRRFHTGTGRDLTGLVLGKGKGGTLFFITLQANPDRPDTRKKRRGRPSAFKNEDFTMLSVKPGNEVKGFEKKSVRIAPRPSVEPTVASVAGKGLVDRVS